MPAVDEVEAWADEGCERVYRAAQLQRLSELPLTEKELLSSLRAAYTAGYDDALWSQEPLTVEEARARAAALIARLPV